MQIQDAKFMWRGLLSLEAPKIHPFILFLIFRNLVKRKTDSLLLQDVPLPLIYQLPPTSSLRVYRSLK